MENPKYDLAQSFNQVNQTTSLQLAAQSELVVKLGRYNGWPEYFPPSCPPLEAQPDNFVAFRIVSSNPPAKQDFESHYIAKIKFSPDKLCLACGLSIFRSLNDVNLVRKRYKPLREKLIAQGSITANDGVVLQTGPANHWTWWTNTVTCHAGFSVIESE